MMESWTLYARTKILPAGIHARVLKLRTEGGIHKHGTRLGNEHVLYATRVHHILWNKQFSYKQ